MSFILGHVEDKDLSLTYMQQRHYDPVIGRFYSNDPVGFTADNPMMFNRYAYVDNNPYKYKDPNGEAKVYVWLARTHTLGESRAGHIAVEPLGGPYLSKFPKGDKSSLSPVKADFHKMSDDVESVYGNSADYIFDIPLPDENAASQYAKNMMADETQMWSLNGRSCVDAVRDVLRAGGLDLSQSQTFHPHKFVDTLMSNPKSQSQSSSGLGGFSVPMARINGRIDSYRNAGKL